jgi:hypothetical protein
VTAQRLALAYLLSTFASAGPGLGAEASRHWLLSVSDVSVSEESCTPHQAVFTVRLSRRVFNLPPQEITVDYTTADGTAIAGVDYTAATGTLTFTPPNQVLTVSVPITDALVPGPDKSFTLNLSNPNGAVLSRPMGTATLHGPTVAKCASCALSCDDGNTCTADSCSATLGCSNVDVNACATAACGLGACAVDTDGDGLSDAWETNGYIDLNCNGVQDAGEPLLPGADPAVPDVYVQYDWMDYGPMETPCNANSDCGLAGLTGFTCSGPPLTAGFAHSCEHACAADADCTSLGPTHVADECDKATLTCFHSHDPALLTPPAPGELPGSLQTVVDAFAARGFNLHLQRGSGHPHSHVLSFHTLRGLTPITDGCEGGSVGSGTAGPGKYAESLYDLKATSFDPRQALVYHYMIFGHYNSCDSPDHCATGCPEIDNPDGTPKSISIPQFQQAGVSEFFGNDFIVSLGHFINEIGNSPDGLEIGGTFMHELGHNLGLHHGGGFTSDGTAEETPAWKPNYLSVMNYNYQLVGIPGPQGYRLDYSTQVLPTGTATPGELHEDGYLDEAAGLGSGNGDKFFFTDGTCDFQVGATDGPVDWDGDCNPGDDPTAFADVHPLDHTGPCGDISDTPLKGHVDWPATWTGPADVKLTYGFQCTSLAGDKPSGGSRESTREIAQGELTAETAARAHVLYPLLTVRTEVRPLGKSMKPGPADPATIEIVVYGAPDLDVAEIDLGSLRFLGARPSGTQTTDVDGDGRPDLRIELAARDACPAGPAANGRLSGWLKNSRVFVGEQAVNVR